MKLIFLFVILLTLDVGFYFASSQRMTLDARITHCLWNVTGVISPYYETSFRNQIAEEYSRLQIITGLTHYPLTIFGNYDLTITTNPKYNAFLVCSWSTYGYLRYGEIIYDSIEMALKEALLREVGATGPATNLSVLQAKNIVAKCKHIHARPIPLQVVYVQNCIHEQIGYLKFL